MRHRLVVGTNSYSDLLKYSYKQNEKKIIKINTGKCYCDILWKLDIHVLNHEIQIPGYKLRCGYCARYCGVCGKALPDNDVDIIDNALTCSECGFDTCVVCGKYGMKWCAVCHKDLCPLCSDSHKCNNLK